jgi:two-component system sensor histidine kinase GlrK
VPRKDHIDLKPLIEKVAHNQMTRTIGRQIRLDIKLIEATVYGDRKELESIFENLFSNAVKFCPNGGVVGCRMSADDINVACIIFDTGPGIGIDEKDKIFQPFYQVETTAFSMVKGSGLGLAIVREYLNHHNGTVEVLNPGKQGARIGLTLPLAERS